MPSDEFPHAFKLMVAGEDHHLFLDDLVADLLLFYLDVKEAGNDVHQRITSKNLFPQVSGFVALGIVGVPRSIVSDPY